MGKTFQRKVAKSQSRKEVKSLCNAICENSAFSAKFFPLCFLRFLLFRFFGCGLPRCALASLRLCVKNPSAILLKILSEMRDFFR